MFKMNYAEAPSFEERKQALLEQMRGNHKATVAPLPAEGKAALEISESDFHMAAELSIHAMDETVKTLQGHIARACDVLTGDTAASMFTATTLMNTIDQIDLIMQEMRGRAAQEMFGNDPQSALDALTEMLGGNVKVMAMSMEDLERMLSGEVPVDFESKH